MKKLLLLIAVILMLFVIPLVGSAQSSCPCFTLEELNVWYPWHANMVGGKSNLTYDMRNSTPWGPSSYYSGYFLKYNYEAPFTTMVGGTVQKGSPSGNRCTYFMDQDLDGTLDIDIVEGDLSVPECAACKDILEASDVWSDYYE